MNCGFCQSILPPGKTRCLVCGRYTPNATIGGMVGAAQFADLATVQAKPVTRLRIGDPWDQIWGPPHDPGFVTEDACLVAGFPGFGKTTMLLAFGIQFAEVTGKPTYYVCSEQSSDALRRTIDRCGFVLKEGQIRVLVNKEHGAAVDKNVFKAVPPGAIMLDSITDFCAQDDYKSQVFLCKMYREYAREFLAPSFIIIQMNKQGDTAGLQKIQHDVDAIIELENVAEARRINRLMREYNCDVDGELRVVVMHKNRNGPTGIDYPLVMTPTGLKGVEKLSNERRKSTFKTGNPIADMVNERELLADELEDAQADVKGLKETIKDLDEQIAKKSVELQRKAETHAKKENEPEKTPKAKPKLKLVKPAPEAIEVNGQTLKKLDRRVAVEGEALKRRRPPMPKKPPAKPKAAKKSAARKPAKKTRSKGR